ncbi:MAG: DUF4388 domain-containing protein [Cystobacterineae bacterium]|nr:DUF4388 domain-containing protein [Cystobacterineae bacterium]
MDLNSNSGGNYVLKFTSGKYAGGEFPIRSDQPVIIGRKPDLDISLPEDMVSRKHARLTLSNGKVFLEDLGSTNGTIVLKRATNGVIVNEEKVSAKFLEEGDCIRIGISEFHLLRTDKLQAVDNAEAKAQLLQVADVNFSRVTKTGVHGKLEMLSLPEEKGTVGGEHLRALSLSKESKERAMMGKLKALPLPDLLQLFHHSKRTGMLVVHGFFKDRQQEQVEGQKTSEGEVKEGRIYMRQGQVYHASVEGAPSLSPRKSFSRIVTWNEGDFELLGADETHFPNEMEESIESLLMEALRQYDELRRLENLPSLASVLSIVKPLESPLNALSKEQLDVLQLIYNHGVFQLVLDHSEDDDAKCSESVLELIRRGYVLAS